MVPPMKPQNTDDSSIIGAFVKDPLIGMHEWIVSFDLASLYPHNQMGCNISPDTLLDDDELPSEVLDLRKKIMSEYKTLENIIEALSKKQIDLTILKKYDIGMTPNVQFYKRDKQGFIPEILHKVYDDRSKAKKKMLLKKQELENLKAEYKHYEN
jgi:DNA polymerase elongation subunit (family B)